MGGAREAGHEVEKVSLKDKTIGFCKGCLACQKTGSCVFAGGVDAPGTVKKHSALEKAREMGRQA